MKKCPFCAEEIQDEAIVCRYCGRELTKQTTQPQPAKPQLQKQAKKPGASSLLVKLALGVVALCTLSICGIGFMRALGPAIPALPSETADAVSVLMPTDAPAATDTPRPTNTPSPTSTPRPTSPPEIGTLDNPYPYGIEAPLTFTSLGQTSDFAFQVLNVIRGNDANNIVKSGNMFNDDPPAGASWMFVQVKVTLTGGSAFRLQSYDLAVISGGQIFGGVDFSVCCTEELGFPELDANIALPGTSVEGWAIRPVLLTDEKPLLALGMNSYDPDLKDGIFFALQP